MNCIKKEIKCPIDIVGRNAHRFVQKISGVKSDIYIYKNNTPINAKSLLGVLSAKIKKDDTIIISSNSEDEDMSTCELNHILVVLNGLGVDNE